MYQKKIKILNHLKKNALKTASKYTWDKRIKKIDNYFKSKLLKE